MADQEQALTDGRRTVGGSLLRQAVDEAERQIERQIAEAAAPPVPGHPVVTAFVAFDKESGAQVGGAVSWRTEKGHDWTFIGAVARKAVASPSPYGVRLELHGRL